MNMKNASESKGIPAVLQNRNGSFRVRVSHYNDAYAAVFIGNDSVPVIVLTKDLVFLDNLI